MSTFKLRRPKIAIYSTSSNYICFCAKLRKSSEVICLSSLTRIQKYRQISALVFGLPSMCKF